MPTSEQLFLLWESQMEFGPHYDEHGQEISSPPLPTTLTGKEIGHIVYDKQNGDLKIILDGAFLAEDEKEI